MADFNLSPNMSMPIPIPGQDPGPDYALNLNSCLTIADGHDHSSGNGVKVSPAGLNISSDLSFLNNNAIQMRALTFTSQASLLSDLRSAYVQGLDLYFNDGVGNKIRITQSGGVAGSPGSISSLTSPASASYVAGSSTFVWQSAASTPANLDAASIILRNLSISSFGLTLNPPNSMGSNFALTLPTIPASQKIMTLDASGSMAGVYDVDNSTIEIVSNTIRVKDSGIVTAKIADLNVTREKLAPVGIQVSSSCGSYSNSTTTYTDVTNLSITITTTGRPTVIQVISDGGATVGSSGISLLNNGLIRILRDASIISINQMTSAGGAGTIPVSTINFIDYTLPAGTYTYKVQAAKASIGDTLIAVFGAQLVVYEL